MFALIALLTIIIIISTNNYVTGDNWHLCLCLWGVLS